MVRFPHRLGMLGLLVVLGVVSPAFADEATPTPARLLDARVGRTPKGMPRLVLETDRPVQFLTVELAQENGFEVHLLGSDPVPPPVAPFHDAVIKALTFREGPQGLVARVTLTGPRRVGTSFSLESPSRVVLDLLPQPGETSTLAAATLPPTPSPAPRAATRPPAAAVSTVTKAATSARPKDAALHVDLGDAEGAVEALDDAGADTTAPATSPIPAPAPKATRSSPDTAASAATQATKNDDVPPELQDLLGWLGELRGTIDSIRSSRDHAARAGARRHLAQLLEDRGLWEEAEKALLSVGSGAKKEDARGAADSLKVAELRVKRGRVEDAMAIAAALDATQVSATDRVRLAAIFLAGDRPAEADSLTRPLLDDLTGVDRDRAAWIVARSLWDRGDASAALPLATALASGTSTPADLLPGALLLEADCLCALERGSEAKSLYERAADLRLSPDEASWATLQLGNLARREGRLADAKRHYETTRDTWPDTFYASQADWFLRFDDRMKALREAGTGKNRG